MKKTIEVILKGYKRGVNIAMLGHLTQLSTSKVEQILKENGFEL